MTIKEQMLSAKAYIQTGQYNKARKILRRIEHPTADRWLVTLNRKYPPKKFRRSNRIRVIVVLIIIFTMIVILAVYMESQRADEFGIQRFIQHIL